MARSEKEYESPFSARYISPEISFLFSAQFKFATFRRLWVALAKAQQKLGLPITDPQIAQMEAHVGQIDFAKAHEYEKKFRHDVMAHIHAFGDQCPDAKSIIHLGATSSYVTDNTDLIQMKEALKLLIAKLTQIIKLLASFAEKEAASPCLSYTHYQSAQPTTIGKRACLWLQDFLMDAIEWERHIQTLPFLGAKGATGTQASFLSLFNGDTAKLERLEQTISQEFGFSKVLPIAGQTYTRKLDLNLLNALESFAASAHKMATDIRLLSHEEEIQEGFGKDQVGSSAMPYKRNPIYSERICGIARFVMSLAQNPAYTTATQWFERTLDDSSNRRLSIPESFLGVDAILNLLHHLLTNLSVDRGQALDHLQQELPFLSMENILMLAVKKGASRQTAHEKLRQLAISSKTQKLSMESLIHQIEKSLDLKPEELKGFFKPDALYGAAPQQVHVFIKQEVAPFLAKHAKNAPSFPQTEI